MKRRQFLAMTSTLPLVTASCTASLQEAAQEKSDRIGGLSLCLNAYSFNGLLRTGEMSITQLLTFSKDTGFHGVDLTAYYIPGYPEVPSDKILYNIKQTAFRLGIAISGTGVRNDFTLPDPDQRKLEKQLVKNWVIAASKIGAPHVRIFDGKTKPGKFTRKQITSWIVDDMKECADFGEKHGVMLSYQNHNDFATNAEQVIEIIERVNSKYLGLMLDTGSLPEGDSYRQIEQLIPYAVSWQAKELIFENGKKIKTDFPKLMDIVKKTGYRGCFPLETLGQGNPYIKVKVLYREVYNLLK